MKESDGNNVPVREQVYRGVRKRILKGVFKSGQRLAEESLAKELDVSRTPVREALHKLELEGLVEPAGRRGVRVSEASPGDRAELFEIRAVLEGHALACVSVLVTERDLQLLHEIAGKGERALAQGALEQVFEYNTQFHDYLNGLIADEKPRLFGLIEDMREYVLRYRKDTLLRNRRGAERSVVGHKKILLALETGDSMLCERIMREHVREAEEDTAGEDGLGRTAGT